MSVFIIKRLLWVVPTLLIIFIICFSLLSYAPQQEVDTYMVNNFGGIKGLEDVEKYEEYYCQSVKKLGLNKPLFYFTVTSQPSPDTLENICFLPQKQLSLDLLNRTGKWETVDAYFGKVEEALQILSSSEHPSPGFQSKLAGEIFNCKISVRSSDIIDDYVNSHRGQDRLARVLTDIRSMQDRFKDVKPSANLLIPEIRWNGTNCRFHRMLSGMFSYEKNISLIDSQPVWQKISKSLGFTLVINLLTLIFSIWVSIRLALWLSANLNSQKERIIRAILFVCYTLPAFWIGSLSLIYLTNSSYGSLLNIFPPGGVGDVSESDNIFTLIGIRMYHFILPVLCMSYPVIAYLTTHLRDSLSDTFKSPFMLTAISKGLKRKDALQKHGLKNAIFPFISLLANAIPSLIAGSVIIEVLFNIPGMGRLAYQSVTARDWPVLFNIIFLTGTLTVLTQIILDILYANLDPRIKAGK